MFTGLVECKGTIVRVEARGADARLLVRGPIGPEPLVLGESIAVDGVCLTVAAIAENAADASGPRAFEADASAETLAKTTLGALKAGTAVNLERAVALGARMGGHIVSGHVDGVGRVLDKTPLGAAVSVSFEAPRELLRYIAPKGSIAVSGVSLTVNHVDDARSAFDVVLVPHTRDATSLDALPTGARVNLEVDLLARYVARLLEHGRAPSNDASLLGTLARAGYL